MKYVIANWKMHTTVHQAVTLLAEIQEGLRRRADRDASLPLPIICPPFVSLAPLRALADRRLLALGAQNCHWEPDGPYTGEISPAMLAGLVEYVLLGHSERRAAGETDTHIARKAAAASACGLTPILFVGEDQPGDDAVACSDERLCRAVSRIDLERQPVLVVYEPAWAIGAEEPADVEHVQVVVQHLKARLRSLGAQAPEVVYGGTVTDENIRQFAGLSILDGVGATRAALDVDGFLGMVDQVARRPPSRAGG